MNKVTFEYMDKEGFPSVSNILFGILADNMQVIAPTGNTREDDYKCWFNGVSDGLKRDERQIVLIKDSCNIIGFFQYYVNLDIFMMEEIQLKPEYHGNGIFRQLYGFLIENINDATGFVEAYANTKNVKSIAILGKMGLTRIGTNKSGSCFHFKGKYADLKEWYTNADN